MQRFRTAARVLLAAAGAAGLTGAQAPQRDATIEKLLDQIASDRIAVSVRTLAGFQTRANDSDPNQKSRGIGAARRWVVDQFRSASPRLEVSFDAAKKSATDVVSVIAVLPGTSQPARRIVVAAHYDSINLRARGAKSAEAAAPGADDDGSGTAVVVELARVMSQYRFQKTIVFIAFAGEEIGLVGSAHYAARARAAGEQIEAVFNNDIVGSNVVGVVHNDIDGSDDDAGGSDGDTGNRLRVYSPDPDESPSRRLARITRDAALRYVPAIRIDLVNTADRYDRGGDQIPFQKNGFAAVRFTSASENSAVQHTADDTPAGVSAPFTANVARANAAAIAGLAIPAH